VSSTFLGLTSCPYLLPSALCRLSLLVPTLFQPPLLLPTTCQLHLEASSTEASSTVQPRTACLPPFLISTTPPSTNCVSTTPSSRQLVCVDHLSSRRLLVDVNYSLYQHPSEIQCAVQNILNERVMDRGYLGDVGRRTVMRFGTVDPKRPAVAILAMHPRSLDPSWRG